MKNSRPTRGAENDTVGLASEFDLDILVEEVANIIYTGQKAFGRGTDLGQKLSSRIATCESAQQLPSQIDRMSVVIRIEKAHSWKVHSVAGAWRRIVMNLLGNAIKWTKHGFVEISLSQARHHSCPESLLAHLSVTDSGSGIAPDYLKNHIFTPFSQEDSLSEGVGLGLSIVRRLVTSLGGYVAVRSEQGVGTRADIYIPIQCLEPDPGQSSGFPSPVESQSPTTPIHACLVGFNTYPDLQDVPTGILSAEAKRKLSVQSTLADVFVTQLGWNTSLVEYIEKGRSDIVVIEEENVESLSDSKHDFKFLVILSGKVPALGDQLPPNVIRVSQPYVNICHSVLDTN